MLKSGLQIRGARAVLNWSAKELANAADLASKTINRLEVKEDLHNSSVRTLSAIQGALELAGIEFIEAADGAPGIIIRTAQTD